MAENTKSLILATVGAEMHIFDANIQEASLKRIGGFTLPHMVHFAWPSPDNRFLYLACSDSDGRLMPGNNHCLVALAVDAATGLLRQHGRPMPLRSRPVHNCLDPQGKYALTAHNRPPGITVHRIAQDGTLAEEIPQSAELDMGIYPHQIMAAPSGKQVLLVARGNKGTATKAEDPGALKLFDFVDGKLSNKSSVAPNDGYGFQPRDVNFHEALPRVYATLEPQAKLNVFGYENGMLSEEPIFERETLQNPRQTVQRQNAGDLHLHPKGHTLYVAIRGGPYDPKELHVAGENSIVVYRLDEKTGEPTLIQHADSRGASPRTFGIDPSGRMLWVANLQERWFEENGERKVLPAGVSTFRVNVDGTLEYVRRYDVDTSKAFLWWSGMLTYTL